MKLLALETSTECLSVALLNEDNVSFKEELTPQKHAELILPLIDALLKENSITKDDLDGIVLGVGPGSFTGVRIAASTAQGLALGLNLKVALVTSLKALALESFEHRSAQYVVSSIDARMGEVYLAVYKNENGILSLLDEERVLKPEDALLKIKELTSDSIDVIFGGSGVEVLKNAGLNKDFEKFSDFPGAQYLLKEGLLKFTTGEVVDPENALPLYVRNEVTWKKVNEQK